jgi:hypothetical protein
LSPSPPPGARLSISSKYGLPPSTPRFVAIRALPPSVRAKMELLLADVRADAERRLFDELRDRVHLDHVDHVDGGTE